MHDKDRATWQGNLLEGFEQQSAPLVHLEFLVGTRPRIVDFHCRLGNLPFPSPKVIAGDPERDPEEIRA
jgi:hypothetical protein